MIRPWTRILLVPAVAASLVLDERHGPSPPERALDWTLGEWTGVRRDGADTEAPMTMTVEPILGGAGQIQRIEVTHGGGVYRGLAVQLFDRQDGVWRQQYANDVSGRFASLEATIDGDRTVWRGTTSGRSRESRLLSERSGPDRWRRTMSVSEDGGSTWRVLWVDDLRRSPAPTQ